MSDVLDRPSTRNPNWPDSGTGSKRLAGQTLDAGPRKDDIRAHVDEAARCLYRSLEAESSMVREHFVRMAARLLFAAAALADGEERRILSRHFRSAQALAVFFYGDGRGVSRLLDELRAMTGGKCDPHSH